MRKTLLLLALLAPLYLSTPAAQATPQQDAAYTYVLRQKVGNNLVNIAWVVISDSKSYKEIKRILGNAEAQELVARELEAARPPYQAEWNSHLASAYARHFTTAELKALAAEGQTSAYARKLREKQGDIGEDMVFASEQLLRDFIRKALTNAVAALPRQ